MTNLNIIGSGNKKKRRDLVAELNTKYSEKPIREEAKQEVKESMEEPTNFPDSVNESFIFSYDHPKHGDYFQELITKNNELFSGTKAEIPTGSKGEVDHMYFIKRAGLITTVYNNSQLKSANLYPITPAQSEKLLKDGKLTNPEDNWEDLALVLYDRSQNGYNPREAQALYSSLKNHLTDLGLSRSDLGNKLIVINAGLERDSGSKYGVRPIVLPGLTQAYTHEVLEKVGKDLKFDGYGLSGGLPLLNQLGSGSRILYMPDETEDIGLRVLCRYWDGDLGAGGDGLVDSNDDGRVNFASQASPKK